MSHISAPYHIVFATRCRRQTISPDHKLELYSYIWGVLKNKGCHVYRINGMKDHVHLFMELNPAMRLADIVRDIKANTSRWMKASGAFPMFDGWAREYFAEAKSPDHKQRVIEYIKRQEEHHSKRSFQEEMAQIFGEAGLRWDDRFLSE